MLSIYRVAEHILKRLKADEIERGENFKINPFVINTYCYYCYGYAWQNRTKLLFDSDPFVLKKASQNEQSFNVPIHPDLYGLKDPKTGGMYYAALEKKVAEYRHQDEKEFLRDPTLLSIIDDCIDSIKFLSFLDLMENQQLSEKLGQLPDMQDARHIQLFRDLVFP